MSSGVQHYLCGIIISNSICNSFIYGMFCDLCVYSFSCEFFGKFEEKLINVLVNIFMLTILSCQKYLSLLKLLIQLQ